MTALPSANPRNSSGDLQRLESVGELMPGLVHEFNNTLQSVVAGLELVRKLIAAGRAAEAERFIESALGSARRAATLNDDLLRFSRSRPMAPGPSSMNEVIRGMEQMVRRSLPRSITLNCDLAPDLWETHCDPAQAELAILKAILNARDALSDHGCIDVQTWNVPATDGANAGGADLPGREYTCITVSHSSGPDRIAAGDSYRESGSLASDGMPSSHERRSAWIRQFVREAAGELRIHEKGAGAGSAEILLPRA